MSIAILCVGLAIVLISVAMVDYKNPATAVELGAAVVPGLLGIALVLLAVLA